MGPTRPKQTNQTQRDLLMTLQVDPEMYHIETKTATVDETVVVPYHSVGITITPINPFDNAVSISYLIPNDAEDRGSGGGEGNHFTVRELVFGIDDLKMVDIPYYAAGTTVYSPVDDETVFVYYLH